MTRARRVLEEIEALFESKWAKLLYHSTPYNFDPSQIRPGSHFGTLHAAMTREWDRQKRDDTKGQPTHVMAYEYNSPGKHIEVPDIMPGWSSHIDMAMLADHLMRRAPGPWKPDPAYDKSAAPETPFIPPEDHKKFFDPATDEEKATWDDYSWVSGPGRDKRVGNATAREVQAAHGTFGKEHANDTFNSGKFVNYLKSRGVTSIQYRNRKEGIGSTSHIVLDPENLRHVHTFKDPKFLGRDVNAGSGEEEYFRRKAGDPPPKSVW